MMPSIRPNLILSMAFALMIGTVGGTLALMASAPMPYLIGAFLFSAVASASDLSVRGVKPNLPMPFRNAFVAVIGVMIGGSFHPGVFDNFGVILLPLASLLVFLVLAFVMNYVVFRRIGGYDKPTAFYSSMPGGLIESITMGEKAGADMRVLSLQQFSRISMVITALPFIFLIWTGEQVGSAAGVSLATVENAPDLTDLAILAVCGIAGLLGGTAIRLPAGVLVGPLILSAAAHYFGLTDAVPPTWVLSSAQVIVGTGLGARFSGFHYKQIFRPVLLAILSVSAMLLLDAAIVVALRTVLDIPFDVLFISFAPGGVTETALIALSLNANPVFVTTLHVFRIMITVLGCAIGAKLLGGGGGLVVPFGCVTQRARLAEMSRPAS